jgi:creatinine amidohydrolase
MATQIFTTATTQDEQDRGADVAVLPVGSFEQHGPALPLVTDTLIACLIAGRIADAHDLFLLPPITISCSHEHADFAGTVSIGARTLHAMVEDIRESLRASGVEKVVLVNGHGGNYVLFNVVREANLGGSHVTLFPARDDWDAARREAGIATTASEDMHAGELETSLLLYAHPEVIREELQPPDHLANTRTHLLVTGMRAYTESGVIGRPSLATAEKGKAALTSLTASFADHLRFLTTHTPAANEPRTHGRTTDE